jgi:predicted ATPase
MGYIRPIRPAPERYYTLYGIQPDWIGVQAENIADFLESHPEVQQHVQRWFVQIAGLSNQVQFKTDTQRGQMEILFTEATTGLEIDISRLGLGYSQILPIVVATFSQMEMLIFEAPEIHLNPSLHGVLTDLFIEGANSGKQILVETHSEHVIYRLQRRIAEGQIELPDVAIYYVRRGAKGSVAERLEITKPVKFLIGPMGSLMPECKMSLPVF